MRQRTSAILLNNDQTDDDMPLWVKKPRRRKTPDGQLGQAHVCEFKLSPNHVLCLSGFNALLPGQVDPGNRQGFVVLTSPDGFPVARVHSDLKPGEVSWVLR